MFKFVKHITVSAAVVYALSLPSIAEACEADCLCRDSHSHGAMQQAVSDPSCCPESKAKTGAESGTKLHMSSPADSCHCAAFQDGNSEGIVPMESLSLKLSFGRQIQYAVHYFDDSKYGLATTYLKNRQKSDRHQAKIPSTPYYLIHRSFLI